ncbi:deferrochelatase/peroxidase EfeB [Lichenibacterium minor]|uniref:Deferrochelatase n=1 Tax=Lichenibacterium minor TaxID=2316528 RepID=A0A4Q2U6G6_9HYPH|nr:iron uptake transporter deferrochelatase/peroxidase subunit [Lichenibacterium minor]RYC32223.1 deferrochelatase/peroxidase EfeB [Lichenibacterium minor]
MTDKADLGRCPFGVPAPAGPVPSLGDAPACPGRRGLLGLLGLAGAAGLAPAAALAATAQEERRAAPDADGTQDRRSFYGAHQSGVVTPQPAAALLASFDVLADSRDDLASLMQRLTARTAALMAGELPRPVNDGLPPPDNGILGPAGMTDGLSMTVGFGASMFDARFGLAAQRPKRLVAMAAFPNDALDADCCHGDLLIQFNANTAETNIHALRAVLKEFPADLALRWKQDGFLPPHTVKTQGRDTARNLLGFKDGTANLDAADGALMDRIVWVGEGSDEPGWARGGSYQVVRIIRTLVERWDRTPLREQQTIIGRDKAEGAPLGLRGEHDIPDYAADPRGLGVPLDAHIRRANPRTAATADSVILRRAYNYSNGLTKAGQLDMGLLFSSFQADLDRGFVAVQTRLNGEALEEYIKPVGGGYFFTLPGVEGPRDHFAKALLDATA